MNKRPASNLGALLSKPRSRGLTLIELLVAMAVGLVVVLAAVTTLTIARRGFTTVDAASQLRDSGRFAADIIQRIAVQAGYRDVIFAAKQLPGAKTPTASDPPPAVSGFNNALIDATNPLTASVARTSTVVGYGSDILVLRYQASQLHTMYDGADAAMKTASDQTMIDCAGNPVTTVPDPDVLSSAAVRMASIFHVAVRNGEPTLMCTYQDPATPGAFLTAPLVQGVEQFQVLYGVDGVTPGAAPLSTAPAAVLPTRYLRADQITVAGDALGTAANWERVRAIRIGLVLRSAANSAQTSEVASYFPFGVAKDAAGSGAKGGNFASSADIGTQFSAPADGRFRQSISFTVHLRNDQGL